MSLTNEECRVLQGAVGDFNTWWHANKSANARELWHAAELVVEGIRMGSKVAGRELCADTKAATMQLLGEWFLLSVTTGWAA